MLNCIDLFAGAGGTALGLSNAGFTHLLLNEFDKSASQTLRDNRPDWNVVEGDVATVDFSAYRGKVDLLEGGFPCQAFSYAGRKRGFEDTRGTLFYEFARAVAEARPRMFMAENVRGLVKHDDGRTLATIIAHMDRIGYRVEWRLLNAADYGVPQKRERIIIVGVRSDLDLTFNWPVPDAVRLTLRDALRNVPASIGASYPPAKAEVLDLVPPGGCWRDLPAGVREQYMGNSLNSGGGKTGMARRIAWDEPCLTLTTSPAQRQTERCHPDETRPFTVREYARIQTFPDSWEFSGGMASQYRQIGNAVPVEFARRLGIALASALES